jgi:hypothetical protein
MAASEDHVAQARLPTQETAAGASRAQQIARTEAAAVERVSIANPGPLFETDGTGASAASKPPASQAARSGSSTLMRVLRYFEPRETPAWPSEGS